MLRHALYDTAYVCHFEQFVCICLKNGFHSENLTYIIILCSYITSMLHYFFWNLYYILQYSKFIVSDPFEDQQFDFKMPS